MNKFSIKLSLVSRIIILVYLFLFASACLVLPMDTYVSETRTSEQIKFESSYLFIWNVGMHKAGFNTKTGEKIKYNEIATTNEQYLAEQPKPASYDSALQYFENGSLPSDFTEWEKTKMNRGVSIDTILTERIELFENENSPAISSIYENRPNFKILAVELIGLTVIFVGLLFVTLKITHISLPCDK